MSLWKLSNEGGTCTRAGLRSDLPVISNTMMIAPFLSHKEARRKGTRLGRSVGRGSDVIYDLLLMNYAPRANDTARQARKKEAD